MNMIKLTNKPANGSGLLAIFCDLDPKDQKEFHPWLLNEMFPARLKIGFNSCASFEKISGDGQKFLTLYEVDNIVSLYDRPYQKLRENRSPLDTKFHESFINPSRYILTLIAPLIEKDHSGFLDYVKITRETITGANVQQYHSNFITKINNLNLLPLRRYITVEGEHDNFTIIEAEEINKIIDLDIDNKISSSNNQIDALYKRKIQLL
ncbi:MAG: hypothetical protein VX849_02875 [Pseudomonadota bacterium]|nr:hypothetical protein [Pseudomonadota bacterium]MED5288063.1 hypothetical protein [Pseudomonadota bacterium]